ncbi:MAG TPA: YidC/Oxa1 family insertase periplasmic-domain containing protein, partial [Pirellulales bacterium]
MDQRRHIIFWILAVLILAFNMLVLPRLLPKQPLPAKQPAAKQPAANQQAANQKGAKPAEKPDGKAAPAKAAGEQVKPAKPPAIVAPAEKLPQVWATLGSGDPGSPYRMLVIFNSRGAAVERIELNSPRYTDVEQWEDRSGYLGHLSEDDAPDHAGCLVRVVGPGTPAGDAGLKAGDVITSLAGRRIRGAADLLLAMKQTRVDEKIEIVVKRDDKPQTLTALLGKRPLAIVKPEKMSGEKEDPLSYLLTLEQLDDQELATDEDELPGLAMRTGNWKFERGKQDNELAFSYRLPKEKLEVVKHFRLAKVPAKEAADPTFPAYHLEMTVELRNGGQDEHTLAYRLDGPTGLPTEGSWYAYKISPEWWDSAGLRDVVVGFKKGPKLSSYNLVSCRKIIDKKFSNWSGQPLLYIGVDSQYFSSALLPIGDEKDEAADPFASELPIRVGPVPEKAAEKKLTDVSCRIISKPVTLKGGASHQEPFKIFAGPKDPDLLAAYGLRNLVEYGMFWWVAR